MVWSQYVDDVVSTENDIDIDEENDEVPTHELTYEEWCDWFSEDLLNMWFQLRSFRQEVGVNSTLLNYAEFSDFCEFVFRFSRRYAI